VRKADNHGFQRHLIRLENPALGRAWSVGDVVPQLVLTNSHKGDASFSLFVGLFELVCKNGLVLPRENWGGQRVPHVGFAYSRMLGAVRQVAQYVPGALQVRESWRRIALDGREALHFAAEAAATRFDLARYHVDPAELLHFRPGQDDFSLWSVFNTVQEAVMRGGVLYTRADQTKGKSRPVNAVDDSLSINQALWRLAEDTAKRLG
jgi:hypothetical protein